MILLGSIITKSQILGLQTGGKIGLISGAVINPKDLAVIAYSVNSHLLPGKHLLLRTADIREIGKMGVIIDSIDELVEPEDIISIEDILKKNFVLIGKTVIDERKHKLGKVTDYTIETDGFIIQQLNVKRPLFQSLNETDLLIHRSQIIEISNTKIVVKSATVIPEQKLKEVSGSYINPFRKRSIANDIEEHNS